MGGKGAKRDGMLASDTAGLDDAAARRFQRGLNVCGTGFGFVHVVSERYAMSGLKS